MSEEGRLSRRLTWVCTALVLLSLMLLYTLPIAKGTSNLRIDDQAIAKGIDDRTNLPVQRTDSFDVNDLYVYSWVKFVDVPSPAHNLTWVWFTPQLHQYSKVSLTTRDPGAGRVWSTYYTWSAIKVNGSEAAHIQGFWQVEVYVDGTKILTQVFSINDGTEPIQPMIGFSWPIYNIKVYTESAPAYAKEDVIDAMKQWNYSQRWFQSTYSSAPRAIFNLIVSDDINSDIRVTFNQTQSNPEFLGIAHTTYNYDSSGRITKVTCAVSLDLAKSDGTKLNDIALKDLAQHELGHCLGLDHVENSGDTMNTKSTLFSDLQTPSTLNLYALFEISILRTRNAIPASYELPSSMQYLESPRYDAPVVTNIPKIDDSSTSKGMNVSSLQPINKTTVFSPKDPMIYFWLKLTNVSRPPYMVTTVWITPQGETYAKSSQATEDPGPGKFWKAYYIWSSIYISGYRAADLTGIWKIVIYINGIEHASKTFSLGEITAIGDFSFEYFTVTVDNKNFPILFDQIQVSQISDLVKMANTYSSRYQAKTLQLVLLTLLSP
ncbi:MAG: hypothetical protein FJ358_01795 [Thaumarchaeota archaeon]|nr:hypothetical protein [Nitrososphaerota archaeon]